MAKKDLLAKLEELQNGLSDEDKKLTAKALQERINELSLSASPDNLKSIGGDAVLPRFEGIQVIEIIERDVNGKFHHCMMSNGTTMHVPIELF